MIENTKFITTILLFFIMSPYSTQRNEEIKNKIYAKGLYFIFRAKSNAAKIPVQHAMVSITRCAHHKQPSLLSSGVS